MKTTVKRKPLAETLAWILQAVPRRPSMPILAGAHLAAAAGGGLQIRATDWETWHTANVAADVGEPGVALVSAHRLRDVVANARGEDVALEVNGGVLVVQCGRSTYRLHTMPVEDYPADVELVDAVATGVVGAEPLRHLLATVSAAVGRDQMLPILTGVHLAGDGGDLTASTTDRFRMSTAAIGFAASDEASVDVVVAHREAAAAIKTLDGDVTVTVTGNQLAFADADRTAVMRRLADEFPRVRSITPSFDGVADTVTVRVAAAELVDACKRLTAISTGPPVVRLDADDTGLACDLHDDDQGDGLEHVTAEVDGAGAIAFNAIYLSTLLEACPDGDVEIRFANPHRPALIEPVGSTRQRHVLMPLRTDLKKD